MVEGSIESDRLVSHIRNKINKHAEILKPKEEVKKVEMIVEEIKKPEKEKAVVADVVNKTTLTTSTETTAITSSEKAVQVDHQEQFKEEKKLVEVIKDDEKGNIPYFIHYVYAPQTFSDENPHACSIM